MRSPWSKRARMAEEQAEGALRRLEAVRGQWPRVYAMAGEARYHGDLNGFTQKIIEVTRGKR